MRENRTSGSVWGVLGNRCSYHECIRYMKPVIQQDMAGCAIASSAAIAGITYESAKQIANDLGISVDDSPLCPVVRNRPYA